jgi:hypothetical protein
MTAVWLRNVGDEDECWIPCALGDVGATEFRNDAYALCNQPELDKSSEKYGQWNADDWHLYLSERLDARANFPNALVSVALRISDIIEELRRNDRVASALPSHARSTTENMGE